MIYSVINKYFLISTLTSFLLLFPVVGSTAFAHGGKKHTDLHFSPLAALKKGTNLFDALLTQKKIDTTWETHLERVKISIGEKKSGKDFRVEFTRKTGKPKTLFLFLDEEGNYTGSNFQEN